MGFGIHSLGESDFFTEKVSKDCTNAEALKITVKPQPQCARVTLLRNLDNIGRRFGSLGLNLTYERLLLGIQAEGPSRFP
jgi:hypothetical protein